MSYNGPERRSMSGDAEQLIQQMAVKQAVIANDITHMVQWTHTHTADDEVRHQDNLKKFDRIDKTVGFQQKIIYGGIGIVAFIELAVKFIK